MKIKSYNLIDDVSINDSSQVNVKGETSKLIESILYCLDQKSKLVYRGVDINQYISLESFREFLFIGGEKARINLNESFQNVLNYSTGEAEINKNSECFDNILDILKENWSKFSQYNIKLDSRKDIDDFISDIKNYRKSSHRSYYDMYLRILYLLHIIQEFQDIIPCVSTSRSKEIAQSKFAHRADSSRSYTIVAFLNNSKECVYYETAKIKKFMEKMGVSGFEDKNQEVIFLDCIFPHNILGIIENIGEEETFMVNPYLLNMVRKLSFKDLMTRLDEIGIEIDQEYFFDKINETTIYKKCIIQSFDERYSKLIIRSNDEA